MHVLVTLITSDFEQELWATNIKSKSSLESLIGVFLSEFRGQRP